MRGVQRGMYSTYVHKSPSILCFALPFESQERHLSYFFPPSIYVRVHIVLLVVNRSPQPNKKSIPLSLYSNHVSTLIIMNSKPTNTLLRLFISIAITVGVVFVYGKPLPDNDQAD